jgi:Protein of unknown function (DUF2809)
MPRTLTALTLLLITIPIGLAIRLLPLHLPWLVYKYGGSILWAMALYWLLAAILPRLRPTAIATIAAGIATLVELSRLIPIAPIDAFRLTFAGKMLLGRYFSLKNIAAYLFAIILTATLDQLVLTRAGEKILTSSPKSSHDPVSPTKRSHIPQIHENPPSPRPSNPSGHDTL